MIYQTDFVKKKKRKKGTQQDKGIWPTIWLKEPGPTHIRCEGLDVPKVRGLFRFETSSKENINIEKAYKFLVEKILENDQRLDHKDDGLLPFHFPLL